MMTDILPTPACGSVRWRALPPLLLQHWPRSLPHRQVSCPGGHQERQGEQRRRQPGRGDLQPAGGQRHRPQCLAIRAQLWSWGGEITGGLQGGPEWLQSQER